MDGEGHIAHRKEDKLRGQTRVANALSIHISNTDEEMLGRFLEVVGMGHIGGPYDQTKYYATGKPIFKYSLYSFEKVQAVIAMLWPWLCGYRKEQGRTALVGYGELYSGYPRKKGPVRDSATGRFT
jgi:hypothetical protein